jgi:hypothetical protein
VVLASAHELYLANQRELHHTVPVLYPFWAAAIALGAEERQPASAAQKSLPGRVPAGNPERGRYLVHDVAME